MPSNRDEKAIRPDKDWIVITKTIGDNKVHMFTDDEYPRTSACGYVLQTKDGSGTPLDEDVMCDVCMPFIEQWAKSGKN